MCMFCAAVPLAGSIGIAITHKTNEKKREMQKRGEVPLPARVSPAKVTTAVVATLLVGSAIYHLAIGPRIGIY